jgi:hypothetical protein
MGLMRFVPHTFRKQLAIVHLIEPIGGDEYFVWECFVRSGGITKVSRIRFDSGGVSTGTLYLADGRRYLLNGSTAQYIDSRAWALIP